MGSKKSNTSTNTTSSYYDNRSVVDAGGGIVGEGNTWDQSQTWVQNTETNWNDNSQTTWTQNTDNSNRSTTNLSYSVVDAGQTALAQSVAEAAIKAARDSSASSTDAALRAQQNAINSNDKAISGALGFAQSASTAAFKSSSDAMGWAGERFDQLTGLTGDLLKASQKNADSAATNVAAAYNNAASQSNGNKTLTIAAMAAVGLVAAFVVFSNRKG